VQFERLLMAKTSSSELGRILQKPAAVFSDPCEVLCQGRLTFDDKITVLKKWRRDLLLSMGGKEQSDNDTGSSRATLRKIDECLRQLYI